jgi:hypothetical protein
MTTQRKIFIWLQIILSLFVFQTFTYFGLGQRLLKNKLLPDYLASINHHSDSIFIRDFYVADCYTGDPNIYISNNLQNDVELIKSKFKVRHVYFDSEENYHFYDTTENRFNLVYYTWAARRNWVKLFGLYGVQQTEILKTDKKYVYKRHATYHWILFFWLQTFEFFESED